MTAPAEVTHGNVRAAESRLEFAAAGFFSVLVGGTLWYVCSLFAEIAPPARLWPWAAAMAVVTLAMAAVPLIVKLRRASDAEIVRVWAPVGKIIAIAFDSAVAASVWLLLPYASEPLRLLMVVLYAAVISGQVVSTAESIGTIVFGVVTIFGSAAIFFLRSPGIYSVGMALFLVAFGLLMIGVAFTIKVAVRSAITARLEAEATAGRLADALQVANDLRESKARFIAAATHDLRQPLQAAALFFNRAVSGTSAARPDQIESAQLAFGEATALLDRLLDHLRIDGGMVKPSRERVELGPILHDLARELAPLAEANGFALTVMPTTRALLADRHLVQRVLRNLAHNAIRHSRGSRILIGARPSAGSVRVMVLDDGRGVSPTVATHLFDAESQGAGDTQGAGIGLPSSRAFARIMGGDLVLISRWRRGAAFALDLPSSGE